MSSNVFLLRCYTNRIYRRKFTYFSVPLIVYRRICTAGSRCSIKLSEKLGNQYKIWKTRNCKTHHHTAFHFRQMKFVIFISPKNQMNLRPFGNNFFKITQTSFVTLNKDPSIICGADFMKYFRSFLDQV